MRGFITNLCFSPVMRQKEHTNTTVYSNTTKQKSHFVRVIESRRFCLDSLSAEMSTATSCP